jgi:hypothetical protein
MPSNHQARSDPVCHRINLVAHIADPRLSCPIELMPSSECSQQFAIQCGMRHIDFLLPFGLPPAEMAADLLKAIEIPILAILLAQAKPRAAMEFDGFSRSLPHEAWLAGQFGLTSRLAASGSPPVATAAMQACGLKPDAGVWFMLHPVHIHIARDHLVLTDMRQLSVSEQESRILFDIAKPLFDEAGKNLVYGDPYTWFVRADDWNALQTSTPDAACGHNIDIWMPKGDGERAWRKLQNEVQMHWHAHAVNAEREMRGAKPVNSLWLWGGTPVAMEITATSYSEVFNLPGWMRAFGQFGPRPLAVESPAGLIEAQAERGLAVFDTLIGPALAGDWSEWLDRFHGLETDWFGAMADALKAGKIDHIGLIFTHNTGLLEFTVKRHSLRKFWVKPSLARLAP